MAKAMIDVTKVDGLVDFVRDYNAANDNDGCPRAVMQYVGKFDPAVIKFAHDVGKLEVRKGAGGGSWPAGLKPEAKSDDAPSVTSKAFDMLLAYSRGENITREDARALWDERESLNAKRRKD